ncbi:MAG TPA: Gfo/Idh/MocA family oxidoreductase [Solirubrobacterales bacterium]|nr:Gfo/Idh/MocA family oxidoreductase [Solirubrobacterales bacterium]
MAGIGTATVQGHLPALARLHRAGARLVATADPDPDRLAVSAARLRGVPTFETVEEMLAEVPSEVLVVAVHPEANATLTALGLRHGRHVVCEKPLALRRSQLETVQLELRRHPELALVPVHQFRFSPTWSRVARWARRARRVGAPVSMRVEVRRDGTDRRAVSRWRDDPAAGGLLADHAVHYLSLCWQLDEELEVLAGSRSWDADRGESVRADLRLGCGGFRFRGTTAAEAASNRLDLRAGPMRFRWWDETLVLAVAGCSAASWDAEALSQRASTDALYLPFYRELFRDFFDRAWRRRRTEEALGVNKALVALLESVPQDEREMGP